MLHPNQFHVNDAWIAFRLNDAPIRTGRDGDLNFIALMDAASCFILSSAPVAVSEPEPSKLDAKRLLKEGQAHKQTLPKTLFIPSDQSAHVLKVEAERQGISVVRCRKISSCRSSVKPENRSESALVEPRRSEA